MDDEEIQIVATAGMLFVLLFAISIVCGFVWNAWFVAYIFFILFAIMAAAAILIGTWILLFRLSGRILDFIAEKKYEREANKRED